VGDSSLTCFLQKRTVRQHESYSMLLYKMDCLGLGTDIFGLLRMAATLGGISLAVGSSVVPIKRNIWYLPFFLFFLPAARYICLCPFRPQPSKPITE